MVLGRTGGNAGLGAGAGVGAQGSELSALIATRRRALGIAIFGAAVDDAASHALFALLDGLIAQAGGEPVTVAAAARFFAVLAREGQTITGLRGDAWQQHVVARLLDAETSFSLRAEAVGPEGVSLTLMSQARRELRLLQGLYRLDADTLLNAVRTSAASFPDVLEALPVPWTSFVQHTTPAPSADSGRQRMAATLADATDWGALALDLAAYYHQHGTGLFARFRAFRWVSTPGGGHLEGVASPDPIRLSGLVGYERERTPVLRNTEQFVAGYSANNVLIYGDQGTGKSSTVKALFNEFAPRGLRLIEVAKDDLHDFPRILSLLRGRRDRFILFVDDLSFEEQETHYKALKAILEGGIEARPDNVLLYATSNRRHLVRERFSDRTGPGEDDDVHVQDTMEEKVSLAARFGIRVTYLSPAQERYLAIVTELARARGLELEAATLRARALQWAQWQNGRSGRTARQFIDALEGELALERDRASGAG